MDGPEIRELRGSKGDKGDKGEPGTPAHLTYQARRDGYIQAAMIAFGPLIGGDLKLSEAVAKMVNMGCNVMAAADKEKP